jgi:hypothetical protein
MTKELFRKEEEFHDSWADSIDVADVMVNEFFG